MGKHNLSRQEFFWSRVKKSDGCWLWVGNRNKKNYGVFCMDGSQLKRIAAHRASYIFTYGEFDKELMVCHKCDNPQCVRPDHLFLGTAKDNSDDAKKKGRLAIGDRHWSKVKPNLIKRGEDYFNNRKIHNAKGEANGFSKLKTDDVLNIRKLRCDGYKLKEIAKKYNVDISLISLICLRKQWSHV